MDIVRYRKYAQMSGYVNDYLDGKFSSFDEIKAVVKKLFDPNYDRHYEYIVGLFWIVCAKRYATRNIFPYINEKFFHEDEKELMENGEKLVEKIYNAVVDLKNFLEAKKSADEYLEKVKDVDIALLSCEVLARVNTFDIKDKDTNLKRMKSYYNDLLNLRKF